MLLGMETWQKMCKRLTGAGVKLLGSSILSAGTGDGFCSSQGAAKFRAKAVRHAARKMYGACIHGRSASLTSSVPMS